MTDSKVMPHIASRCDPELITYHTSYNVRHGTVSELARRISCIRKSTRLEVDPGPGYWF